jgi:hypothetical protein
MVKERGLCAKPSVEEITEEVESVFGEDGALARGVIIYLCHKDKEKRKEL